MINWYKLAKQKKNIVDLAYEEWKRDAFEDNVNTIIRRIYDIGVEADASKKELSDRIKDVMFELIDEEGKLGVWRKILRDKPYFRKIKEKVISNYGKIVRKIEKAQEGPIPIDTPQSPDSSKGKGGGGLLM